jgi:hypothetical protein
MGESRAGARTLSPPPGFYEAAQANDARVKERVEARRRDAIDMLVGHEVAHVTQGDFTCPHPTATRESGDATWTVAEARAAQAMSERVYTSSRVLAADATATRWLIAQRSITNATPTSNEEAYVALLTVFNHLPASAYARLHQAPAPPRRGPSAQIVRASAAQTRAHPRPAAGPR